MYRKPSRITCNFAANWLAEVDPEGGKSRCCGSWDAAQRWPAICGPACLTVLKCVGLADDAGNCWPMPMGPTVFGDRLPVAERTGAVFAASRIHLRRGCKEGNREEEPVVTSRDIGRSGPPWTREVAPAEAAADNRPLCIWGQSEIRRAFPCSSRGPEKKDEGVAKGAVTGTV